MFDLHRQTKKTMRDVNDDGEDASRWNAALLEARTEDESPKYPLFVMVIVGAVLILVMARSRWWECSWLLAECYMYRRIHEACLAAPATKDLDPFQESKDSSFQCSLEVS